MAKMATKSKIESKVSSKLDSGEPVEVDVEGDETGDSNTTRRKLKLLGYSSKAELLADQKRLSKSQYQALFLMNTTLEMLLECELEKIEEFFRNGVRTYSRKGEDSIAHISIKSKELVSEVVLNSKMVNELVAENGAAFAGEVVGSVLAVYLDRYLKVLKGALSSSDGDSGRIAEILKEVVTKVEETAAQ